MADEDTMEVKLGNMTNELSSGAGLKPPEGRERIREAGLEVLIRAQPEKRYTLAVAWGLEPDKRPAADGHRVRISPDVLEETAWGFMRTRGVGLYHQDGTMGHGEVVESYIYRGPDWEIEDAYGNKQVIRAGYWLVGNVWDESAWKLVKRGLLNGLSPQGVAKFRLSDQNPVSSEVKQ